MLLTFEEIISLVTSKESNTLEFKETTGQLTRGMESGCAFMNSTNGGYLLFGVSDKGKIIGTIRLGIENGRLPESIIENTSIPVLSDKLDLADNGSFKNAAAVLFARKTSSHFPQCKLRLARFKGNNRMEFIDNAQMEGNIFVLFDEAMSFFFKHLSLSGKIIKAEREEELAIPYKALREAVINAFCHRDYSNPGGSTGIAIYDDKVEIINPGKLPKGIDINNLKSPHKSIPNNPLIANVLYRRKMLESWGRGLDLMYSECKRVGLPIPTLSDNQGEVVVTFYLKEQVTEQVTEQVMSLIKALSDKEMSIKEILEALSLKHRPTLLSDYIQPTMQLGFVEQTQPDSPKSPTQKYRLTDKGKKMI